MYRSATWLRAALLLPLLAVPVAADEAAAVNAAKTVLGKYQDAIVTVKLVVKTGDRESQVETTGTVLSPDGLTVISDFSSNPLRLFREVASETTDVQVLLKDGRELPGKFVLRDRDLDLAFVLPNEKGLGLTHVKLEKGPVPAVLDDLIYLNRLGKSLNREASVALGRVSAVVRKPRTLLVPDSNSLNYLGCPVFDGTGRPVGLVVMRRGPGGGGQVALNLSSLQTIILTSEDVQQVAGQVGKQEEGK